MKFTVLISVYKKENPIYLSECLDSVLSNTVLPDEIIIVKDGELTAELDSVLDSYCEADSTIKLIPLKENCGLGRALSEGLKYCSYDMVARMDTDDICASDRFETQLNYLQSHEEVSLVGGYITEFIDDKANIVSMRKVPLSFEDIKVYSKKRNPVNHVSVMFRKKDILDVGGYQKVKDVGYEDYDLWIRLIMAGCVIENIDKVLVNVRVGADMYKRRGNKKRLKTALFFRKKLWKLHYYGFFSYVLYSAETIAFACVPSFVRKFLYKKVLRK